MINFLNILINYVQPYNQVVTFGWIFCLICLYIIKFILLIFDYMFPWSYFFLSVSETNHLILTTTPYKHTYQNLNWKAAWFEWLYFYRAFSDLHILRCLWDEQEDGEHWYYLVSWVPLFFVRLFLYPYALFFILYGFIYLKGMTEILIGMLTSPFRKRDTEAFKEYKLCVLNYKEHKGPISLWREWLYELSVGGLRRIFVGTNDLVFYIYRLRPTYTLGWCILFIYCYNLYLVWFTYIAFTTKVQDWHHINLVAREAYVLGKIGYKGLGFTYVPEDLESILLVADYQIKTYISMLSAQVLSVIASTIMLFSLKTQLAFKTSTDYGLIVFYFTVMSLPFTVTWMGFDFLTFYHEMEVNDRISYTNWGFYILGTISGNCLSEDEDDIEEEDEDFFYLEEEYKEEKLMWKPRLLARVLLAPSWEFLKELMDPFRGAKNSIRLQQYEELVDNIDWKPEAFGAIQESKPDKFSVYLLGVSYFYLIKKPILLIKFSIKYYIKTIKEICSRGKGL